VSKTFGAGTHAVHAVAGVDLELGAGSLAVLVGRSGSGKSTLLSILGGWQSPDAGEVLVGDHADRPGALGWRTLAYLPQRFGLIPELSVRANVELPARIAGAEASARVEELLEELGLAAVQHRLPAETSIGEQQRTALARALALRPAVLLADEPVSHQDARRRETVLEVLHRACDDGTAVLVATHEPLLEHAAVVWRMAEGKLSPLPLRAV
jgi:putative ABC transport system ATP-binding protein